MASFKVVEYLPELLILDIGCCSHASQSRSDAQKRAFHPYTLYMISDTLCEHYQGVMSDVQMTLR